MLVLCAYVSTNWWNNVQNENNRYLFVFNFVSTRSIKDMANLPAKTHEEEIKLKKTVYDFVPQQYHETIEFSFQIFDTKQFEKKEGWRIGFSTFTIDEATNFVSVPEIAPNPEPNRRNMTSHTHLTRNREKEDIECPIRGTKGSFASAAPRNTKCLKQLKI